MVQCQRELAQQNRRLVYCNTVQFPLLLLILPPPPLFILPESIHWGNDGGLVTAYSTPGVSQQTHPGEPAPNWADTFAAEEANKPQLVLNLRGPRGLCILGDKKAFYGNDDFPPSLK